MNVQILQQFKQSKVRLTLGNVIYCILRVCSENVDYIIKEPSAHFVRNKKILSKTFMLSIKAWFGALSGSLAHSK